MRRIIVLRLQFAILSVIVCVREWPVTSARPVDYIAPVNPCRLVDRFCSVKCKLWQMEGQFDCDFCVCPNKTDYVKWETTPVSTLSPLPTATLPPDTIIVNNIKYHRVGDPCRLSRDGMCPSTCTELHSTSRSGSACTQCDCRVLSSTQTPDEQELLKKLFNDQAYDNSVRPVFNSSKNVEVTFGFTLIQIMDMDEKNQLLVTNVWLEMAWKDERIGWKKEDYNGLEVVRLPAKLLWLPDIVLYNNADDYTSGFMPINAMVHHDGTVFWSPPVRFKSSCKVDITYFPFDHQLCTLKFGSWTYDKAQVDMLSKAPEVDVSAYVTNGEWMLTSYNVRRNEVVYPISPAVFPDVTVYLTIQRRILYYVLNILFPCFWLNILSVLTFCLPPDAGEKITLSITVLLSYSVFMLLVAESMPPTSEFVPLIGIYLTVSMAVASVSVILTVLVLKLHHCSPNQKRIPRWVRCYVLGVLARIVRCNCVAVTCNEVLKKHKDKYKSSESGNGDVQVRLIKEMEAIAHKNGSNHITIDTSSKHGSSHIRNSHLTDLNSSRLNLDFRDISASNRSSVAEDNEGNLGFRIERSHATMEDILKYLKMLVMKSDSEDAENEIVDEWKQVALVVDRLFFWLFLFLTILSTVIILVIVPSFKYIADDGI